jgi:hypothetical protein
MARYVLLFPDLDVSGALRQGAQRGFVVHAAKWGIIVHNTGEFLVYTVRLT